MKSSDFKKRYEDKEKNTTFCKLIIFIKEKEYISKLIDNRIELGLPLDNLILQDFEKKTKHLNYIFLSTVDFIHEFFKIDNKINTNFSKEIFNLIDKSNNLNRFFSRYANKGLIL